MTTSDFFSFDPVNSDSTSPDFVGFKSTNLSPEETNSATEKGKPLNRQAHDKPYQNDRVRDEDPLYAELTSIILRETANLKLKHQLEIDNLKLGHEQALAEKDRQLQYLRAQITMLRQQLIALDQQIVALRQPADGLATVAEPGILSHISTTYRVVRSQSSRFNRSVNTFQQFLLYVIIGLSVAGVSAIALSYTTLWPAVFSVIRPIVPFIFVAALIGIVAIFLWEFARSQSHKS